MIGALLFASGLLVTLMVGVPIASRAARPDGGWSWLRRPQRTLTEKPKVEIAAAFTPLDLGPDPMQWPSQRPWPASPLGDAPWPSQTWNDVHFGAHWRAHPKDPKHAAPPAPTASAEADFFGRATPVEAVGRAEAPRPGPQRGSSKQAVRAAPAHPGKVTRGSATAAPVGSASRAPSREEVEALVAEIGLAGTVQRIMERTGWDFRQAAQYLARVRQGP